MKQAITTEATTDEIAGWVLERWQLLYPKIPLILTDEQLHGLREAVLTGIRAAVDMDRDGRLDYSPEAVKDNASATRQK